MPIVWIVIPRLYVQAQSDGIPNTLNQNLQFERLSVEHGLSQSTVNCILQDSKGYMWFGTLNGLNKYDGYSFSNYRHDPDDPNSISSDQIFSICEDSSSDLWIGTLDGLNKFDSVHETFVSYRHIPSDENSLSHNVINVVYEDRSGMLWVGTPFGLNRLDKETGKFTRYRCNPNDPMGLSHNNISAIYEDTNNYLWIGTSGGGITKLDPAREKVSYYFGMNRRASLAYIPQVTTKVNELIQINSALCSMVAIADSQDITKGFRINKRRKVLIISVGEGTSEMFDYGWLEKEGEVVWQMNLEQTMHAGGAPKNRIQLALLTLEPGDYTLRYQTDGSHGYNKWNRLPPHNPELWGVQILSVSDNEVTFFKNNLQNYVKPSAPSNNMISAIMEDKNQILWIGTQGGGVNTMQLGDMDGFLAIPDFKKESVPKASGEMERFVTYRTIESKYRKIYNSEVFERIDSLTKNGSQLAAVMGAGDFQELENTFKITKNTDVLILAMGEGTESMDDTGFLLEGDSTIWEMQLEKTYHAGGAFKNRLQIDLINLAPGTYKLRYRSDDLHSFEKWNALPPKHPELWGIQGLAIAKAERAAFKLALAEWEFSNTIVGNGVQDMHIDDSGTIWIATNNGLSKFDSNTGLFRNFRHDNTSPTSLSSNEVQSIYEDRSGTIWIGTVLGGINKLNRNKNLFPHFTTNPFVENTLRNKVVYSFCEDRKGLIWVGTRTGINLFDRTRGEFYNH